MTDHLHVEDARARLPEAAFLWHDPLGDEEECARPVRVVEEGARQIGLAARQERQQAPDDDETFAMDSFDREVEPAKFAPTVSPASVIKTSSVIDRTAPSAPTPVPNLRDERERANSL